MKDALVDYQARQTEAGVDIVRLSPEVVASFTDESLAAEFLHFLKLREGRVECVAVPPSKEFLEAGVKSVREPVAPAPTASEPGAAPAVAAVVEAVPDTPDAPAPSEPDHAPPEIDPEEWTAEELVAAFERLARKERVKDVAADYGKSWSALRSKWAAEMAARRQGAVRAVVKPGAQKPEVKPEPKPAVPPAPKVAPEPDATPPAPAVETSGFVIDLDKAKGAEKLLRMHLRAVGYAAPWTPALDLRLVEGLARGDGLGTTAAGMKMSLEACRARWKALMPGEVTIDGQKRLLATLKALAAENGARAA